MQLLCSDLDRTYLPNGEDSESPLARPILQYLVRTLPLSLVFVSGRDLQRVHDAIDNYALPEPVAIASDVGSSIYWLEAGEWKEDSHWQQTISQDWCGLDAEAIGMLLREVSGLQQQEADRQAKFKCSFYFSQDDQREPLLAAVDECLHREGINASLVVSIDPQKQTGLLDVVPARATKREAVKFIQARLMIADDQVLFAGDSGNDIEALSCEIPGVLVANGDDETRRALVQRARQSVTPLQTYLAKGGVRLADGQVLNGNYAGGIVEGLVHFRPELLELLQNDQWLNRVKQRAVSAA